MASALKNKKISMLLSSSKQAFGQYKLNILILSVLGFLGGLLEAIGINAIIPVFSFIAGDKSAETDFISGMIEKLFLYVGIDFRLKYLLVLIVVLFIFKAIALLFSNYIRIKITSDYEKNTRISLLKKMLDANWPHLLKQKVGHLETVLMTDIHYSSLLLRHLGGIILLITSLLMYILVAVNISAGITLLAIGFGGIIFFIFKPLIYKKRMVAREISGLNRKVAHFINENVIGLKTIKAAFVGNEVLEKSRNYFVRFRDLNIRNFMISSVVSTTMHPISLIFVVLLFSFYYKTTAFNFGSFVAIIYLTQRIFSYIQQIQLSLHKVNFYFPFLQSVLSYEKKALDNKEDYSGRSRFVFNESLNAKDIDFAYGSGDKILSKLNFEIKKGEMVGLIGPSGVGKTTLVDIILRLLQPSKGELLLDGKNISDINMAEWRNSIGYVSQDIFLMNDTIENNIRFYDDSLSDKEIEEAAKMANIYDFIKNSPDGFNTVIGERGIRLSAGQRQRIVIARALARKPQFLILDEATSALDSESEAEIRRVIENLKGKITVLVVAHRLSTLINSDKLLILEGGRITEQGSPQELLKDKESYFYKMYNIRK